MKLRLFWLYVPTLPKAKMNKHKIIPFDSFVSIVAVYRFIDN